MRSKNIIVATYNIHRCFGTDGKFNLQRIIDVIKQLDADIVALQEVETRHDGGLNILDEISAQTGMYAIAGPTMFNDKSHYGNAILTNIKCDTQKQIDISIENREPRGAISLTAKIDVHRLHFVSTHLGLLPGERRTQIKQILDILEGEQSDISILTGDLNEWFLWGRPLRWLRKHFEKADSPATFPSRFPFLSLDQIWIQPRVRLDKIVPVRTKLTKVASDHLPLKALLTL